MSYSVNIKDYTGNIMNLSTNHSFETSASNTLDLFYQLCKRNNTFGLDPDKYSFYINFKGVMMEYEIDDEEIITNQEKKIFSQASLIVIFNRKNKI